MPDFNVNIVPPSQPGVPKNSNQNDAAPVRIAEKPSVRNIPPITKYNSETGTLDVDEASPWHNGAASNDEQDQGSVVSKTESTKTTNERHEKWKVEQAAKREAKAAAKIEKASRQQLLAKDLLRKGDLTGAAAALDMSPQEFALYAQNAMLHIPNKEEELTPEQKKAKEDADWRAEVAAFKKEQQEWKYQQVAANYIRDNIDPVLADKEKYELLNRPGTDLKTIKNVIYEYMNKHYQDTCVYDNNGNVIKEGQILNPADIAETMEQQVYNHIEQLANQNRGLKKTAKLFAQQQVEQEAQTLENELQAEDTSPSARSAMGRKVNASSKATPFVEPTVANKQAKPLDSRFPLRDNSQDVDEEAEVEELNETEVPKAVVKRNGTTKNTPFALLSREERLALMKAGR